MNAATRKGRDHFYEFGPFRLDAAKRLLTKNGELVGLKKKAVETLLVLIEGRGQVIEKDVLMHALWPDSFVEESNLTQYIYLLRKTLGDGINGSHYIATVSGRGYRFTADVHEAAGPIESFVVESRTVARLVITEEETGSSEADSFTESTAAQSHSVIRHKASPSAPGLVSRHPKAIVVAALAMAVAGVAFGLVRQSRPQPVLPLSKVDFLTNYSGNETQPAFSPDGKQIAFVWDGERKNNLDIYVKLIGVGSPLRLTTDPGLDHHPIWSPDGRFIAFLRGEEVVLVPALGGAERVLGQSATGLDWSPDGQTLAIAFQGAIHLFSIETGEKRKRTSSPAHLLGDSNPSFSPDGQQLAFIRQDGGAGEVYVTPVGGGDARRLTENSRRVQSLAWTADGRHVIYASNRSGSFALWKVAAFGGIPEQLKSSGTDSLDVSVGHRGSQLAYAHTHFDTNIWHARLQEPGSKSPTQESEWTQWIASANADDSPQYSPDGKRIVFASNRTGDEEIWICQSDGSNAQQLTWMRGPSTGSPRWSPDGKEIAFDSRLEGHGDIFVVSANGGQPRRLTTDPSLDVAPSWSRDGQWIYFSSMRSGERQLWKVPSHGGSTVQVTQGGGFDSFESPDGMYLYFTRKRETAGLWRMAVGGGEEIRILELDGVKDHRAWTVTAKGIYFVPSEPMTAQESRSKRPSKPTWQLRFFSFSTGKVSTVIELEKRPVYGPMGLAVSPDGRSVLYVQRDSSSSDIMLVENFQ